MKTLTEQEMKQVSGGVAKISTRDDLTITIDLNSASDVVQFNDYTFNFNGTWSKAPGCQKYHVTTEKRCNGTGASYLLAPIC